MAETAEKRSPTVEIKEIPPWAKGDNLRHVEIDVLIPRIMKTKAKVLCQEYVNDFAMCAKGRTISMAWACRKQNSGLQSCLKKVLRDPALFEECKEIYLQDRETYQNEYVSTGQSRKIKRKENIMG